METSSHGMVGAVQPNARATAARDAALANRQAIMDAATQRATSNQNSDMGGRRLPHW